MFLAASAAALTAASAAYAADAPPAAQAATTEEIVVTGTAGGAGVKKLEAGYSITTIQAAEINRDQPKSSAELPFAAPRQGNSAARAQTGVRRTPA